MRRKNGKKKRERKEREREKKNRRRYEMTLEQVYTDFYTLLKVVGFSQEYADQGHKLQLGKPLACRGRQRQ